MSLSEDNYCGMNHTTHDNHTTHNDNHTTTNTDHKRGSRCVASRAPGILTLFFCLNPHSHISDDDTGDHGNNDALEGLKQQQQQGLQGQSSRPCVSSPGMFYSLLLFLLDYVDDGHHRHAILPRHLDHNHYHHRSKQGQRQQEQQELWSVFYLSFLLTNNFYILDLLHVGEPHDMK